MGCEIVLVETVVAAGDGVGKALREITSASAPTRMMPAE
jgi:hypothetical protein